MTTSWISRAQLRASIDGYRDLSDQAFDRQFSRDKAALRDLGVNILTREHDDFLGEDESDSGYRVGDEDYELPDLSFTPAEAAALAAAAGLWRQAALGPQADRALTKLKALGADFSEEVLGGVSMLAPAPEKAFRPLYEAARDRRAVGFTYRKPGTEPAHRRLEPYGLVTRAGRSYVLGRDLDREDRRLFRVDRVQDRVAPLPGRRPGDYEIPEDIDFAGVLHRYGHADERHTARLRVAPGRGQALRRRGRELSCGEIEIGYRDEGSFAAELASYGPDVTALAPDTLVEAVRAHLGEVVERLSRIVGEGTR